MNIFRTISVLLLTPLAFVACNTTPSSTGGTGGWSPDDATIDGLEITSVVTLGAQESATLEIQTDASWELSESAAWLDVGASRGTGDAEIVMTGNRDGLTPDRYETFVDVRTSGGVARAKVSMRFPSISGRLVEETEGSSTSSLAFTPQQGQPPNLLPDAPNNSEGLLNVVLSDDALTSGGEATGAANRGKGPPASVVNKLPEVAQAAVSGLLSEYGAAERGGLSAPKDSATNGVVDGVRGWVTFEANNRGDAIRALNGDPRVKRVSPDVPLEIPQEEEPNEVASQASSLQPTLLDTSGMPSNHDDIQTVAAHTALEDAGLGFGSGVTVAVIDSGVDVGHPDLVDVTFADGYNFVDNKAGLPAASEAHYHGTHVAGIIAAAWEDNGSGDAAYGVSRDVTIVPLTVLGQDGRGSTADVARAILYAAGDCVSNSAGEVVCGPEEPVDVINLSLGPVIPADMGCDEAELNGYLDENAFLESALEYAARQDVVVVAAAGNDSLECFGWPAASDNALAVSAVNTGATSRASFSNHGPNVEGNSPLFIAAPGTSIESLFTREYQSTNFGQLNGTSMATPHVAAVAALVQTADSNLNASAVAANLACNATVAGFDSNNDFGSGLLSAERSVTTALNGGSANPYAGLTVEVTPNRGEVTVTEYGTFNIDNLPAGDYTLRVSGQTETVPVEVRYETGDRAGVQLPAGSLCGN